MVQIVWTRRTSTDVWAIRAYIDQFAPTAAERFAAHLIEAAESLAAHPERGRLARAGRRELVIIRPYVIIYRLRNGVVEIVTVRHGARRR